MRAQAYTKNVTVGAASVAESILPTVSKRVILMSKNAYPRVLILFITKKTIEHVFVYACALMIGALDSFSKTARHIHPSLGLLNIFGRLARRPELLRCLARRRDFSIYIYI